MKYLKKFELTTEYESYMSGEPILPNVSYVVDSDVVRYNPKKAFTLRAQYNATPDNLVAFTGASNLKSLKVNGAPIEFEPAKNESTTFDVLGENISIIDVETYVATFPDSYLIKSPVSSWSFKAKDPNYTINENTYVCALLMMDGATMASPMPIADVMSYAFTTNDGVTLEVADTFLAEMNAQIQSGVQVGFTLCDMDMNSGTFVFIDTENQTNVTTGGLPTYSFDSEGLYDVEIESTDLVISMQFAETPLISIEIGSGVTEIGRSAFENCSGLTSIVIPDSVTSIGSWAFSNCSGLTEVTIGSGVTSIGDYAFRICSELTGELVIPDSVTYIGNNAFDGCKGLTGELVIPDSVTYIGNNAFDGCRGLTGELVIPDSVTYIGEYAFMRCSGLTEVTIGSGVTSIGDHAFMYCSGLTGELVIPDSVISIGWQAFENCSGLTGELVIPDSVTSIGESAFHFCSGLTEVTIGSGVTTIGDSVFSGCSGLTGVTIPDSITSIGSDAFWGCSNLNEITCLTATSPSIQSDTFENVKEGGILKVPAGSDYSSWMSTDEYYLGYYNWTIQTI